MKTDTPASISEVLKFAQDYKHNPNQHIVLDPYKDAVLLLRAKYATYDTITETLNEKGVKVSEATVRNFCRRHHEEMKRLRSEQERKRREITATASPDQLPGLSSKRSSQPSDAGKPGPKIARDEL